MLAGLFGAAAIASWAAPTAAPAQTFDERQCRAAIAGASARYNARVARTVEACHRRRSKGALGAEIDCNDVATSPTAAGLGRHRQKLRSALVGPSSPCAAAAAVLASYARCPSPAQAADDGGATDGIDTFDELAACFAGLAEELIGQAGTRALGDPQGALRPHARRCQKSVGKRLRALLTTYAKERARCQNERDLAVLGFEYGCEGYDANGKIAAAREKLKADIARQCALDDDPLRSQLQEIDALGACGDTVGQLQECVAHRLGDGLGAGLIAMAYELPAACGAGSLVRVSNAGVGAALTSSSFSGGWNGIGHDIDLTDRFRDAMHLSCDDDCAHCALSLDALANEPDAYCRCARDATLACDTVGGPDVDDCGVTNNECQCFLGPPVAVSAGGAPACITVRIDEGHGGSIDLGRGDWENTLGLSAVLHLGTDLLHPCPLCENDPVARDGVRGGTCSGGVRSGQPCDVNAVQPTFGPSSYDCPPPALTNISGAGLGLRINMTTEPSLLASTRPCDSPGGMCPCRVCSGDTTLGCNDDALCAAHGVGTCTGGGGAGVQPNACADRICSDGLCTAGPTDRFCDLETYADGRGYVACLTDIDCSLLGAGTCTLIESRRCYDDPIATDGEAGFFGGIAGTIGCLGLTNSAVVNQATGLPGAIRVVLDFDTEVRCANDPRVLFDPPSGANCPDSPVTTTTTTTLLPPIPCALTFPLCGGDCPPGTGCALSGLGCACLP